MATFVNRTFFYQTPLQLYKIKSRFTIQVLCFTTVIEQLLLSDHGNEIRKSANYAEIFSIY